MATLIVEDGTGLPNANSYISLDDATAYHAQRSNDDWGSDADAQTNALLIAAESLELLYGNLFLGSLIYESCQALLFPRVDFVDNNGRWVLWGQIPKNLAYAQAEIALLVLQDVDVFPMKTTSQNIASQKVKVGELETQTTYLTPVETETYENFRKVDLLLAPLIENGKGSNFYFGL